MADKSIDQLNEAEKIYATDLFVLQQSGAAKKLTGQVLLNWLTAAADGHGGIQSIEKLSTNILADTYRITLADTTTFDFVVNNGRGITGISKTRTSGLVDTYTISYNNDTTSTFTVTNGAKGDKGDNAYIWIKYASQEPTESSHSMGDIPDDWIGIYSGNASTAPTDWKQYVWFQIKGEKGDTGNPATILSRSVTYQVGDSGTVEPSGSWLANVPSVPQGKYLWTRTVLQFNTGDPITWYSVSYSGINGTGAVSTVAGISPDENGNVSLSAENVGARPSTWTPTASEVGAIPNTSGSVTREKLAQDALYSPITKPTTTTYNVVASDLGKTIVDAYSTRNNNLTWNLSKSLLDSSPIGTEIAFARTYTSQSITLSITGARIINADSGQVGGASENVSFSLPEKGSMCALKKLENDSTYGSFWILTGNVEVVS